MVVGRIIDRDKLHQTGVEFSNDDYQGIRAKIDGFHKLHDGNNPKAVALNGQGIQYRVFGAQSYGGVSLVMESLGVGGIPFDFIDSGRVHSILYTLPENLESAEVSFRIKAGRGGSDWTSIEDDSIKKALIAELGREDFWQMLSKLDVEG